MKVINLLGGAGLGKSTAAAGLFYELKRRDINAELVPEYAKELVWEGRMDLLEDQLHILAQQNRRLLRLKGKVDIVVTDAPLLHSIIYEPAGYPDSYVSFCLDFFNLYDNVNFVLNRTFAYRQEGRFQDEAGAIEIDRRIVSMLKEYGVPFTMVSAGSAVEEVLTHLGLGATGPADLGAFRLAS